MTARLGNEAVSVVRVDLRFGVAAMGQLNKLRGGTVDILLLSTKAPSGAIPEEARVAGLLRETEASEKSIYHCLGAWECGGRCRPGRGSNVHRHLRRALQA
ncbi:hypothetical protein N181_09930 [Sinorhizobium fredii USDA 205]|nr:hypothetical protein N181_09930 [Sinorhizobium fredii USDA 205]GEC30495.1 hypothetical protein EFR01_06660 [Sinorhizobium fredii]GLS09692.1 hypothetical protein GCM10007864_33230 [Sinorhizobium fredii]